MLYSTEYASPLGAITLGGSGETLSILKLTGHRFFAEATKDCVKSTDEKPAFRATEKWLDAYFSGKRPAIADLPLAPTGSRFQQAVWGILCQIPYGRCVTYGDIAKQMAARMETPHMSARAVGGAVGHNPISIVIPCHRVIGSNGSLTGYGGGIGNKIKLLTLEGLDMEKKFIPKKGTAL